MIQVDWDSVVVIATFYGLDSPEIKSGWWQDFLHPFRLALMLTQPPVQWVLGLLPRC
jgi:hypothetical protein